MEPTTSGGAGAHLVARPDRTVVCLHGEIDISTASTLEAALVAGERTPAGAIVVDLTRVRFMDSSGLDVLLARRRRLAASGRNLVIQGASGAVLRLLELAGSHELLVEPPLRSQGRSATRPV